MSSNPSITLYTNHRCPWAHRAHIVLAELGLPFKEETIDLDTPRTESYLAINPRGLVPSLSYNGEIIIESAIVAQFLVDAHPEKLSHLAPPTGTPEAALRRARIALFVDTWFSKVNSFLFKAVFSAQTEDEAASLANEQAEAIVKEIEPLLKDAKPFFGGSDKLTLAEVQTGSFILRHYSAARSGIIPSSWAKTLEQRAPNFTKWADAVQKHPSVNGIYNEEDSLKRFKAKVAEVRKG